MSVDLTKIAFDSRLNYLKRGVYGSTSVTYGSASSTVTQDIAHGLGYVPFVSVGAELFSDGVIWSNEYVWEGTESSSSPGDAPPNFLYWTNDTNLTVALLNGDGTGEQSGSRDIHYATYIDYGTVDPTIAFSTKYPIDKIVQEGEVTIVNDGDTTSVGSTTSKIVSTLESNSYGRAALVRARWSVDGGTNWQSLDSKLVYTWTDNYSGMFGSFSTIVSGLRAAISIGSDGNFVYFRTANGLHGNVSSNDSGETYTPTSQTFLIQYALYERE